MSQSMQEGNVAAPPVAEAAESSMGFRSMSEVQEEIGYKGRPKILGMRPKFGALPDSSPEWATEKGITLGLKASMLVYLAMITFLVQLFSSIASLAFGLWVVGSFLLLLCILLPLLAYFGVTRGSHPTLMTHGVISVVLAFVQILRFVMLIVNFIVFAATDPQDIIDSRLVTTKARILMSISYEMVGVPFLIYFWYLTALQSFGLAKSAKRLDRRALDGGGTELGPVERQTTPA